MFSFGWGATFCPFSQQKVGNSLGYFGFPSVNSINFAIFWENFLQFFNVVKLGEQKNPDWSTLATLALIIVFVEILKFPTNFFLKEPNFVNQN